MNTEDDKADELTKEALDRMSQHDGPEIVLVWDPEILTEEQYADLVEALGDVVRAHGGTGVARTHSTDVSAAVSGGVLL